ncbi:MAG: tetratricopeptide repeat protein, partial [Pseudomonadales bacterium]|nr:tetratricopeptide repeat protein [Pseudomonadales bacterium]
LAKELRSALGDASVDEKQELFTVGSLEAAREYVLAQRLHLQGKDDEAIVHYRQATELDPEFGRAYSGWALSEFRLGRIEESEVRWQKALSYLDRMTERERLRTLGLYYLVVSKNYDKAVDNYQELVNKYPADSGGHNNLAIAYFYLREFAKARHEGGLAMAIYPKELIYKSNFALYAMYASEFDTAVAEASQVIKAGSAFHKAYLPLAIAAVDDLDLVLAKAAYKDMAATNSKGASLAAIGLADIAVYEGELDLARSILADGIAADQADGNSRGAAIKLAAMAEVHYALGNTAGAQLAIDESLDLVRSAAGLVSAAGLLIAQGEHESAQELANELGASLRPESRAYGKFIEGQMARLRGEHGKALD